MSRLDLPNYNSVNGMAEDKIFALLFVEKGLDKYEIAKEINVPYEKIFDVVKRMEEKGFIICREFQNGNFYYLTSEGCREAEYRFNSDTYLDIYGYLIELGYYSHYVLSFMKNVFYKYYLEGVWNGNSLETQYLVWCDENKLNPEGNTKKLKK